MCPSYRVYLPWYSCGVVCALRSSFSACCFSNRGGVHVDKAVESSSNVGRDLMTGRGRKEQPSVAAGPRGHRCGWIAFGRATQITQTTSLEQDRTKTTLVLNKAEFRLICIHLCVLEIVRCPLPRRSYRSKPLHCASPQYHCIASPRPRQVGSAY